MEKFIEERLNTKNQKAEEDQSKPVKQEDDDLYVTPEHLRLVRPKDEDQSQMLTGIVEVELPIEFKLKNIEETESAKRQLLGKSKKNINLTQLPANMSVNFSRHQNYFHPKSDYQHHHQSNHQNKNRTHSKEHGQGLREGPDKHSRRLQMATDDIVLERFKKRFRY